MCPPAGAHAVPLQKPLLLNAHAIRLASTKGFRVVHLFRFHGRNNKLARRRRARDIRIIVNSFPQERRERLRAIVAQVLVIEPNGTPQPPTETETSTAVSH